MSLEIRSLRKDDRAAWAGLWAQYIAFYEHPPLAGDVVETTFARLIDPQCSSQNGAVACAGDEVVGLAHFIYHPHNWRMEEMCYLQDLFTAPHARGQGVARALITHVAQQAHDKGAGAPYWLTQESNSTARHLYDQVATLTPFVKYQM